MGRDIALSWSVLSELKEKAIALVALLVCTTLPLYLLAPRLSIAGLVLSTIAVFWLWRLLRRIVARIATRALAAGDSRRATRLYWMLRVTGITRLGRQSCRLSLAACAASESKYELAESRLVGMDDLEGALLAVSCNLRAYCLARRGLRLDDALQLSDKAIVLRSHVLGFRHTRGLVYLEMGRLDEASRDLESTWKGGNGSGLFEAERCFDLGRLWDARGHGDYAHDYFQRAFQASPDSHWARESKQCSVVKRLQSVEVNAHSDVLRSLF